MNLNWTWIGVIAAGIVILALGTWFVFFRSSAELTSTETPSVDFGTAGDIPVTTGGAQIPEEDLNTPINTQPSANQKIFRIAEGPVAGAILIQTTRPTTTLARYVLAESGRIFDLPLEVSGALPRTVSNTTIPGIVRVLWRPDGSGALLQYEDDGIRKTLYLGLLNASTTLNAAASPQPTRVQYLPDSLVDVVLSPDGRSVSYLLATGSGVDGYVAQFDGLNARKLFSLPLSHMTLTWPSPNVLLMYTKPTSSVTGGAFTVNVQTGAVSTLMFAQSLSALADRAFSRIVYQTTPPSTGIRSTYVHDIARNSDQGLSFSPIPEKCAWGVATTTLYCATPTTFVPSNYLDTWHLGTQSASDSLISYNITTGASLLRANPGSDGGVPSDMIELSPSPDDAYLSFIRKGDRTLWGVKLK